MRQINVCVDLDKRKVDAVELSNNHQSTIREFLKIQNDIQDFSETIYRKLSKQGRERR